MTNMRLHLLDKRVLHTTAKPQLKEAFIILKKHKIRTIFIFLTLFIVLLFGYGTYIEPNQKVITHETVRIDHLPVSWENTKIAFFSDINLGSNYTLETLTKTIEQINATKPDIIIFTGHFFDSKRAAEQPVAEIQKKLLTLRAPLGKYALLTETQTANTTIQEVADILANADFQILTDELRSLYRYKLEPLHLLAFSQNISPAKKAELIKQTANIPSILLAENPQSFNDLSQHTSIQLMFSQSTYGGFIGLPYINTKLSQTDYPSGLYHKERQTLLVSNGLGTPQHSYFRLFNYPTLYIITLQQRR